MSTRKLAERYLQIEKEKGMGDYQEFLGDALKLAKAVIALDDAIKLWDKIPAMETENKLIVEKKTIFELRHKCEKARKKAGTV